MFEGSLSEKRRLSRYDRLIARHAEEAGFDWRLVAALIFEESRFDHTRVSDAGAFGLMQVMPFTAQLVGIKNYLDPREHRGGGEVPAFALSPFSTWATTRSPRADILRVMSWVLVTSKMRSVLRGC